MTAISIADRSTLTWGDDALGPKNFDSYEPAEVSIAEQYIASLSPETRHQVDTETAIIDNWVAFKVAPIFLKKIYAGEELAIDLTAARNEVIIPEYLAQQAGAMDTASDIAGRQTDAIRKRIAIAESDVAEKRGKLQIWQDAVDSGNQSPRIRLNIIEETVKLRNRIRDVKDLQTDIDNHQQQVDIKTGVAYTIEHLLTNSSPDQLLAKTDEITLAAKKIAINQVIGLLKADIALLTPKEPKTKDIPIIEEYLLKIELLEAELAAHERIELYVEAEAQAVSYESSRTPTPTKEIPTLEVHRERRTLKSVLLGSLGARAIVGNAAFK